jgi:DNA-binding CsgD family transcriptional regulator
VRNAALRHRGLSRREVEIASMIRQGMSTKQIAELLHLSPRSVDFHRYNLRKKLAIGSTRESLISALRRLSD